MRSSKKRSRSNQNRPRSLGNIVNRVFDSSGPEGKVRGTPQQIIEKYNALARDAQLSNDRVAAENFLQHAEHYTRLLAEAQRELAAEQEARQQHNGHQNGFRERDQRDGRERGDRERSEGYRSETPRGEPREPWPEDAAQPVLDMDAGNGVIDLDADGVEVGLVELPEMSEAPQFGADDVQQDARSDARAERKPRGDAPRNQIRGERRERTPRRERAPRAEAAEAPAAVETPAAPAAPAAVEADAGEAKPRRERRPRKPRVAADGTDTPSAAE